MTAALMDAHVTAWRDWRHQQAGRFLHRLDPEAESFTFQTFDDTPEERGALAGILHGDLDGEAAKLEALQRQCAGVFVTVNATDGKGRKMPNVERVRAVFVDLDGTPLAPVIEAGLEPHIVCESSPGRFHAYWLTDDCPLDQFGRVQKALARRFNGDPTVHDLPRVMRLPGFRHFKREAQLCKMLDGIGANVPPYALAEIVAGLKLELDAPEGKPRPNGDGKAIPEGGRNGHLTSLAGSMRRPGMTPEAILAALRVENEAKCSPPLQDEEVVRIAASIAKYPPAKVGTQRVMLDATCDTLIDVTQDNVATIFAQRHGHEFRYSHDRGNWFSWDGLRWREETTRLAFDYTRQLTRTLNTEGKREFAKASFCEGVEKFAQADRVFALRGDEWDCDPWILNTQAGSVNLHTGDIQGHDQADLITKLTGVAPQPGRPELWLEFLNQVTEGDNDLIAFLQRVCGYALTGDTREECLFYIYGPGGNGKGTFAGVLFNILGDYAANATMDTFLASRHERHSTDLAMLRGARLVTASETAEGRAWDEQRVKAMTGNDPITARFMRQDNFTYLPQFKLILLGNNKPVLRTVDDAWRRRFHIIPFSYKPPEKDLTLKARLVPEYPRIVNWMIEGCLMWQAEGLKVPQRVLDETADYFAAQDIFADWVATCCETKTSFMDTSRRLFASWKDYAEHAGEAAGTGKALADRLQQRGYQRVAYVPMVGGRGFKGLRVHD